MKYFKACKNCHLLTKNDTCPNCSLPTAKRWTGYVIIRDPPRSQIAKKMNITKPGIYALKVM
ncbi:MAG: transcription elongation factor subunit Spt4 [Methanobacteriota archaeon]